MLQGSTFAALQAIDCLSDLTAELVQRWYSISSVSEKVMENKCVAAQFPPRVVYLWLETYNPRIRRKLAKQRWLRKHHLDGKDGNR